MSAVFHKRNTLQTEEYFALGTHAIIILTVVYTAGATSGIRSSMRLSTLSIIDNSFNTIIAIV